MGNDLVALNAFALRQNFRLMRWLQKVAQPEEAAEVRMSCSPQHAALELWARKESAYKVLMQQGVWPFLNAKRIAIVPVSGLANGYFEVQYEEQRLFGHSQRTADWIHSSCSNYFLPAEAYCFEVLASSNEGDRSAIIRQAAQQAISRRYGVAVETIRQTTKRIPQVLLAGQERQEVAISFSHDGAYSAFLMGSR